MSKNSFEAVITISAVRKTGYVTNPENDSDIEIKEEYLNHALQGDTVLVELLGKIEDEKEQGKVLKVLERAQNNFVGLIQKTKGGCFVLPDNRKMYVDIFLPEKECANIAPDYKVFVAIDKWEEGKKNPTGKLLKVIGPKGDHETEIQSIVLEKGIEADFPRNVEDEAKKLDQSFETMLQEELSKREDFRNTTTFTIDPKDAKDFDDALSLKKLDNGNYQIGVHIADVSQFVRPGTELDKEAYDRAFSVYLVDRTIPMLPEILSNGLCSLNPNEDRFAFSAVFELNENAEVQNEWFGKSIINSNHRFSYEDAEEVLDKKSGDYHEELEILLDLSQKLTKKKLDAGAIRFEKDEFEFILDSKKVPLKIVKKKHLKTHKLIEEFMLLANRHVAKFIHDKCKDSNGGNACPLMYRVHNVPDVERISELTMFLKALGYNLPVDKEGHVTPQNINELLAQVHGKDEESLITTATIRTMSKAIYSTENLGHFGLAFEYYTHFTSPIRRYPDLIVHRILEDLLKDGRVNEKANRDFAKIAEHSTEQEINAQSAERESIRYKQVEFMANHVGEEFEGIISGVAPFGIFVVLDDTGAEGMVHISKLGEEYFNYDEKNYCMVSESGDKKFTLGDKLKVKIESANLDDRKLDMRLA